MAYQDFACRSRTRAPNDHEKDSRMIRGLAYHEPMKLPRGALVCVWTLIFAQCSGSSEGQVDQRAQPDAAIGRSDLDAASTTGDSQSPSGDGTIATGKDTRLPLCEAVCWTKQVAQETTPSTVPTVVERTGCNVSGLEVGKCPLGFDCTGSQTYSVGTALKITEPLCESAANARVLSFKLPPENGPEPTVDVQLKFTMNGGPWPSAKPAKTSGTVSFFLPETGSSLSFDLPTNSEGILALKLQRGSYLANIALGQGSNADSTIYPAVGIAGTLQVAAAGTATIDFTASKASVEIAVDGAVFGDLVSGESASLILKGAKGGLASVSFKAGEPLSGVIALVPDVYTVEMYLNSKRVPGGPVVLAPELDARSPTTQRLNAISHAVSGLVTIDGMDLPPSSAVNVSFNAQSFTTGTQRPARYSGRVWAGDHKVSATVFGAPLQSLGTAIVVPKFTAGPSTLDVVLTTSALNAEVLLNGATLPDAASSRGSLTFAGSSFDLGLKGPAIVSGRVLSTSGEVRVNGTMASGLPQSVVAAKSFVPASSRASFNIVAGKMLVEVTVNGASAPPATNRGSFYFSDVDSTNVSFALATSEGALSGNSTLPVGRYKITYTPDSGFAAIPSGSYVLGSVDIPVGVSSKLFDVKTATVSVEVTSQAGALPPPQNGDRGLITGFSYQVLDGILVGSRSISTRLPATGAAKALMNVASGVWTFSYTCDDKCGLSKRSARTLVSGLTIE